MSKLYPHIAVSRPAYLLVTSLLMIVVGVGLAGCPGGKGKEGGASGGGLPAPDSKEYAQAVSAFYIGLAALETREDRAENKLNEAAGAAPGEPAIWANLGLMALRRNDLPLATERLKKAKELAGENAQIEVMLGILAGRQGQGAEAVAHLKHASELEPDNVKALYAWAKMVEMQGGDANLTEYQRLIGLIIQKQPDNVAALLDMANVAAKRNDAPAVKDTVGRVMKLSEKFNYDQLENKADIVSIKEALKDFQSAANGTNVSGVALKSVLCRNVLARVPEFRLSRNALSVTDQDVSDPVKHFLKLPQPKLLAAAPDTGLTFAPEPLANDAGKYAAAFALQAGSAGTPSLVTVDAKQAGAVGAVKMDFPGNGQLPTPNSLCVADLNYTFKNDVVLAGAGGLKIYSAQKEIYTDTTTKWKLPTSVTKANLTGVWAADIEADGDLDLVLGVRNGATTVLRNNGDGTFKDAQSFPGAKDVRAFAWADFDGDGDPDAAMIDGAGTLTYYNNERGGQFTVGQLPALPGKATALACADVTDDGILDLLVLTAEGKIVRISKAIGGPKDAAEIAGWQNPPADLKPGVATLFAADLDNNGSVDIVASSPSGTVVFLSDGKGAFTPLAPIDGYVTAAADRNGDGRLDLLGVDKSGKAITWTNRGTKNYRYAVLRPKAKDNPPVKRGGDGRINSFGIGGEIELRSGLLTQKRQITGPTVHFGLGELPAAEVMRIVWPNGSVQAEFPDARLNNNLATDQTIVVDQRLLGSCPFLFTWNGTEMAFVTDCIWRSPLGLKINAQATAGVAMTEDWVKIRGDQLVPKDGFYDLRITAELWETHFFDHLALMTVDHPADTDIWVDERFAIPPPPLAVIVTEKPQSFARVTDDNGSDVSDVVRERDGRYVDNFGRGQYQGVTRDHYIEMELGPDVPTSGSLYLIAHGWIHPTDSSVNVAIGQGSGPKPQGLSLETPDASGKWTVAKPGLGFPTGKVKTVVLNLNGVFKPNAPRKLRLRTNLEIYWDSLAWAEGVPDAKITKAKLDAAKADLRFRGFSEVKAKDASSPELPQSYDRLVSVGQKWRDLIGYHTRFGDVRELLTKTDDRYVIMNAGDEMRLLFPEQPAPASGLTRDYILIGDGWVKDGNYNTTFSKTVLPLPMHKVTDYSRPPTRLEDDPVYKLHAPDWQTYHTRYVTPERFLRGMR